MAYTTINKGSDYFNTVLFTGNGGSTIAVTGVGFQPDWVWLKSRSDTEQNNVWDSVRGSTARLMTDGTNAEYVNSTQGLQSFDSDGFTGGQNDQYNKSGQSVVGWNWLAGGTASSNTDGSITSSVSANTTAGFSIVSYTGTGANATVGHGLGVAPKMLIVKNRDQTYNWTIYHSSLGNGKRIRLNTTDASSSGTNWNSTTPTSSVFSIGTNADVNGSTDDIIAYCFAEKKGFSKFGTYTGNGSTDGPFIYTGFKPAFVIFKSSSAGTTNWQLLDNKRNTFNPENNHLRPNSSAAEFTNYPVDFISNGFKFRNTDADNNGSGTTFIYMAFAEHPFVSSTGTPVTAR